MLVSVDVGGTFTDVVVVTETLKHYKVPSTPENPAEAVVEGFPERGDKFIHGTTVATNAFLEKRGVKTSFITNRGFEDLLHIGRQTRPALYDLHIEKPQLPIGADDCYGITGRINEKGDIIQEVDTKEIKRLALHLKERDCSAAVCLLHSYKNKRQEEIVGEILNDNGVFHSLSNKVSNEFREYERGVTTLLDAYLGPVVKKYFEKLREGTGVEPLVMKSSGGLQPASYVNPIDTFYSGPAGGVAGGKHISELLGIDNLITFDMGGTSADMATIIEGDMSWKDQGNIGGFPVQSKMVDIETIGAGGGSIAWVDDGGVLRVGPRSAGARPGPACYGGGGREPTITDALLLAGYIDKDYFLGGEIELHTKKAEIAIDGSSKKLGIPMEELIIGIIRIANSKMTRCMKEITVERGLSPSEFSILAFGGAGPIHAAYLAEDLGIDRVLVPPAPDVFSALGMLTGNFVTERARTVLLSMNSERKLRKVIEELSVGEEGEREVYLGLRYKGQSHHLNLLLQEDMVEKFHLEHEKLYGYADHEADIEIVNVRLEHSKKRDFIGLPETFDSGKHPPSRMCLFPDGKQRCKVFYRKYLQLGYEEEGPAVIEDSNSTILIPPSWAFKVIQKGILEVVRI